MENNQKTLNITGVIVGISPQVKHVLVRDENTNIHYAVTPKTAGDNWSLFKKGQILELCVTDEPLRKVLSAKM